MAHDAIKEIKVPTDKKARLKYYKKEIVDIESKIVALEKEAAKEKVEADEEAEVKKIDDAAKKKVVEEVKKKK